MSTVKITTTNFEQEVLQSQIPVLLVSGQTGAVLVAWQLRSLMKSQPRPQEK